MRREGREGRGGERGRVWGGGYNWDRMDWLIGEERKGRGRRGGKKLGQNDGRGSEEGGWEGG